MSFSELRNAAARSHLAVTIVQSARVARTVKPAGRFVAGIIRDAPAQRFRSRRLGHDVYLRPRGDLQVARELVSKNGYALPGPVEAILASVAGGLQVVDVGANIGLFAVNLRQMVAAEMNLVAIEPDPANLPLLRANLAAAGMSAEIIEAAAGVASGVIRFAAGERYNSRTLSPDEAAATAISVPVIDVFALLKQADLIKMDIEGSEWPILQDPRLKDVTARVVVMETHHRGSPSGDPVTDATELLRAAGYETWYSTESRGNDIWAWKRPTPVSTDPPLKSGETSP